MSDVAKYLPLSSREREDESTVTNDWSKHLYSCLRSLANTVEALPAEALARPTAREHYRVVDVVSHLLWQLGTPRSVRARRVLSLAVRGHTGVAGAVLAQSRALSTGNRVPGVLAEQIRALAAEGTTRAARRTVAELSVAVVDGYDVAQATGSVLAVDPVASGAVALARSLSAPVEIRAVLRDCTLRAADGGWSVGQGATRLASAQTIVLFLWGRGGIPAAADAAGGGTIG